MVDPAERIPLGDTGLKVTRLGLGTGMLGASHDDETWHTTIKTAWEHGVRFYDTSPFYGFGNSEIRIGAELSGHDEADYVLATKVGRLLRLDADIEYFAATTYYPQLGGKMPDDVPRARYDYSRTGTLQSILESSWRLGRSKLDVVHIHDILELSSGIDHTETAIAEAYPALVELKEKGAIGGIGVGVQDLDVLVRVLNACDLDVVLVAGRFTLLDQSALDEALPLCLEKGVSVIIGSPYNTGLLHDPTPDKTFDFVQAPPELIERAIELKKVCDAHDVPLPAAAIQFPFQHPAVTTVLTGATAPNEVRENVEFMQIDIPDDLWAELKAEGYIHPALSADARD